MAVTKPQKVAVARVKQIKKEEEWNENESDEEGKMGLIDRKT